MARLWRYRLKHRRSGYLTASAICGLADIQLAQSTDGSARRSLWTSWWKLDSSSISRWITWPPCRNPIRRKGLRGTYKLRFILAV